MDRARATAGGVERRCGLDALLWLFFHERYRYEQPAKSALIEAVHPDATRRLARKMLEHDDRASVLRRAAHLEPRSRFLRSLSGDHVLLGDVDAAFVEKHDLRRALREVDEGWVLVTSKHRAEDVDAILDRLGDRIVGVSFRGRRLPAEVMSKLAALPMLARVRQLDLSGNPIGTEGVAALLKSPHLGGLTHLALDHCALGTPALTMLGHTSTLPALRHLSVAADRLGAESLDGLLGAALERLETLSLAGWVSGAVGPISQVRPRNSLSVEKPNDSKTVNSGDA